MAQVPSEALRVTDLLGGPAALKRDVTERLDWLDLVREGLPYRALEAFAEKLGIPEGRLAQLLGMPPRTAARRKGRTLRPQESDRLYRIVRIAAQAVDVLGSEERAATWLRRPNRALAGQMPLDLLDTDVGAREVEKILGRIAFGVHS